jgi:hypothetical protein
VDQADAREHDLRLAALEVPDEVPREPVAPELLLGHEVRRDVLADEPHARFGERPERRRRHVLGGGQHLDALRGAPCARAGVRDPLLGFLKAPPDDAGVEAGYEPSHASAACRPVTPRSRRCEKKSSGLQLVQRPQS